MLRPLTRQKCHACAGTGKTQAKTCPTCKGTGQSPPKGYQTK